MSSSRKQVLGLGIFEYVDSRPEYGITSQQVHQMIDHAIFHSREAGYDVEMFEVNPNLDDNGLGGLREKLRSKKWDIIQVGWGVRGDKDLTSLFENCVNICLQETKNFQMAFPTYPTDMLPSLERVAHSSKN